MFMVAPSGSTKLTMSSGTPSLRAHCMFTGSVALEEELEKASNWAGAMPR